MEYCLIPQFILIILYCKVMNLYYLFYTRVSSFVKWYCSYLLPFKFLLVKFLIFFSGVGMENKTTGYYSKTLYFYWMNPCSIDTFKKNNDIRFHKQDFVCLKSNSTSSFFVKHIPGAQLPLQLTVIIHK